jgi:hypothetical protein
VAGRHGLKEWMAETMERFQGVAIYAIQWFEGMTSSSGIKKEVSNLGWKVYPPLILLDFAFAQSLFYQCLEIFCDIMPPDRCDCGSPIETTTFQIGIGSLAKQIVCCSLPCLLKRSRCLAALTINNVHVPLNQVDEGMDDESLPPSYVTTFLPLDGASAITWFGQNDVRLETMHGDCWLHAIVPELAFSTGLFHRFHLRITDSVRLIVYVNECFAVTRVQLQEFVCFIQ